MNKSSLLKTFALSAIILIFIGLLLYVGESGSGWSDELIIWQIRVPKIITAFLAGGLLSATGYLLQIYFQNPLAGPDLLGINSGASLGIAIAIMGFSASTVAQPLMALIGALGVLLLLSILIRKNFSRVTVLIMGLLIASFTSSLISLLVNLSAGLQVKNYLVWAMGTFQAVPLQDLKLFVMTAIALILYQATFPKKLNLLLLGDSYAHSMGLKVKSFKFQLMLASAFSVALVTVHCGPIGFIGIIAPHLARWTLKRSDAHFLLPVCFLMGSLLALLTELILIFTHEYSLATNSILGIIGAPIIAFYLLKKNKFV